MHIGKNPYSENIGVCAFRRQARVQSRSCSGLRYMDDEHFHVSEASQKPLFFSGLFMSAMQGPAYVSTYGHIRQASPGSIFGGNCAISFVYAVCVMHIQYCRAVPALTGGIHGLHPRVSMQARYMGPWCGMIETCVCCSAVSWSVEQPRVGEPPHLLLQHHAAAQSDRKCLKSGITSAHRWRRVASLLPS